MFIFTVEHLKFCNNNIWKKCIDYMEWLRRGVGKKRPAGQILPAQVFFPALGVDFLTQSTDVYVKCKFWFFWFLNVWPEFFLKRAADQKICQPLALSLINNWTF